MRLVELEAVVLQRKRINTQDCYLTLFSRQMGRVDVFARNANHPKSPLTSGSSPFSYGLYQVSGKGSLQLRSIELKESFYGLRENFESMLMGSFFSKLMLSFFQEKQVSQAAFELFVNMLTLLQKFPVYKEKLLVYFEAHLIEIQGIQPDLSCVKEGDEGYYLSMETGEAIRAQGKDETKELLLWKAALEMNLSTFLNHPWDEDLLEKTWRMMENYLHLHLGVDVPTLHRELSDYMT